MLTFYKTVDSHIKPLSGPEAGCWLNVVNPTEEEIHRLTGEFGIEQNLVRAALDEEESSRIDQEGSHTLLIVDMPVAEKTENSVSFSTIPMGIILTDTCIVTVCLKENTVMTEFAQGLVKNVQTAMKTRFVLIILLRLAARFLLYLRQIDKVSNYIEKQLHGSLKNKELIQLLDLEKSLVYFSTSLKANEITLEKILRGRVIKLYEEDQELLEDVLIEVKQAIEMSNIYSSILSGTMDAFASVISNNLNNVMKILTSITVVLAIPTIVFSFYGMNTRLPFPYYWVPLAISAVGMAVTGFLLYRKKMF